MPPSGVFEIMPTPPEDIPAHAAESAAADLDAPAGGTDRDAAADGIDRTFVCSVLTVDIAAYARKPVSEQILLRERFNARVADAIADLPPDDRIILDTAGGVAINFLGDPSDALSVGIALRDAFRRPGRNGPRLEVRMGLNRGPVRLVKGPEGQPSIMGDGIDVAQRLMTFAEPGQVIVSRSFFDAVSRLSADFAQMFEYVGLRTDEHVREHEVWEAVDGTPSEETAGSGHARVGRGARAGSAQPKPPPRSPWLRNRRLAYAASAVSVVLLVSVVMLSLPRGQSDPPAAETAIVDATPALQPLAPPAQTQTRVVDRPADTKPQAPRAASSPGREPGHTTTTAAAAAAPSRAAKPDQRADPGADKAAGSARASAPVNTVEKAEITLAVSPWGEIYVNGARVGVTPPMHAVEVAPGRVEIEIRNGSFPSHVTILDLEPGQRVRLKHKFY